MNLNNPAHPLYPGNLLKQDFSAITIYDCILAVIIGLIICLIIYLIIR